MDLLGHEFNVHFRLFGQDIFGDGIVLFLAYLGFSINKKETLSFIDDLLNSITSN